MEVRQPGPGVGRAGERESGLVGLLQAGGAGSSKDGEEEERGGHQAAGLEAGSPRRAGVPESRARSCSMACSGRIFGSEGPREPVAALPRTSGTMAGKPGSALCWAALLVTLPESFRKHVTLPTCRMGTLPRPPHRMRRRCKEPAPRRHASPPGDTSQGRP